MDDFELLREYVDQQSEAAFSTLMQRHASLVYSAALRQVRNPHLAEEVTQVTFIILAKKAHTLRRETILSGWLYRTTRFAAFDAMKAQMRRQQREHEASQMGISTADDFQWKQIEPLLDEAVSRLGENDRNAVLLRFFENKRLTEVGAALGTNEEAARKRIARALEKLRVFFTNRGITIPAAALAGLLSANAVLAAPTELISPLGATLILKDAASMAPTLPLLNATLKLMAWAKIKTGIALSLVVAFIAGTTLYSWEYPLTKSTTLDQAFAKADQIFAKTPPQVRIVPSSYSPDSQPGVGASYARPVAGRDNERNAMGLCVPMKMILFDTYQAIPTRTLFLTEIPKGYYDYFSNSPPDPVEALREEIKRKYGLVGKKEMRETDVLVLKIANPDLPGLKTGNSLRSSMNVPADDFLVKDQMITWFNVSLADGPFVSLLESTFGLPVMGETGLTNRYDFTYPYPPTASQDDIKKSLKRLGLELIPARRSIEMLVVKGANE